MPARARCTRAAEGKNALDNDGDFAILPALDGAGARLVCLALVISGRALAGLAMAWPAATRFLTGYEGSRPMVRSLLAVVTVVVWVGCQAPPPTVNPFLGQTRIPPPGTGQAVPGPVQPYYQGSPPPGAPTLQSTPGATAPPAGSYNTPGTTMPPPGSYGVPNGSASSTNSPNNWSTVVRRSPDIRVQNGVVLLDDDAAGSPGDPAAAVVLADHETAQEAPLSLADGPEAAIRIPDDAVELDEVREAAEAGELVAGASAQRWVRVERTASGPVAAGASATRVEPARIHVPTSVTNITDLPAAGSRVRGQSPAPATETAVQPRTAAAEVETIGAGASVQTSATRYGHDPGYAWLAGKLEYSRSADQWKLRYIPIDGQTDDFGGSVLIKNAVALEAFEPGDFVRIEGSIAEQPSSDSPSFAPLYQVRQVRPLSL